MYFGYLYLIRGMKKIVFVLLAVCAMACGKQKNIPDVSHIKVDLQTIRFENDFFAIDTNHIDASLQQLHEKYPGFTQEFLYNILGTSTNPDSAVKDVRLFIASYRQMYDSSRQLFTNFSSTEKKIKEGLQHVKYYFPNYHLPAKLITFIGPINSYGNIITQDALGIGLQLYMGKNYSVYNSDAGKEMYPTYLSRRFDAAYLPANCMKNIIDDMYPAQNLNKPLIEQMIDAGKRLYLLDTFLPETPDSIKTGYTKAQLDGCYDHEKNIWTFFMESNLLYATDLNQIAAYINDGPNTTELGPASPGNIGQFVGWQIVKKWMQKNEKLTLDELMNTPNKQIVEEAKYKPN
jgi:hypothetical protein